MRRKSPKSRAADKAAKALLLTIPRCELCRKRVATDCHEIARGIHRMRARGQRIASLGVCRECHDKLSSRAEWPEARQLAALRRSRPDQYDLAAYNALVGRGPCRITEEEVSVWKEAST